ncbi:MAG TPA: TetR/AcrR family transcriptional regulator [Gemmatimonadaceae bacterium]|jgi:AcrR family transcriptional regulator|nr:TetR/AcrR family transcriptional regulator [Gemmatimonadaceae bacterium]
MPGTKAGEAARREQVLTAAYHLATKRGLSALTIRGVADRAGLSSGLVLFHFGNKEQLLLALLEWVLEATTVLRVGPEILAIEPPIDRLLALVRQEMERLSREPARIRLFFDFWSAAIWNRPIRVRMKRELDRYRDAFLPIATDVLAAEPDRFPGVTADGLSAVAVSFIKGCAVQSMIEPQLDIAEFLAAVEGLIEQRRRARADRGRRRAGSGTSPAL